MAALPEYVTVLFDGYGEEFEPAVLRSEMERGPPKERLLNTQVLQQVAARLLFKSKADAASFEAWYFDTIKRVGYFDVAHPRTGNTISAKFRGGEIGRLVPLVPDFSWSVRDVVIEYMRG